MSRKIAMTLALCMATTLVGCVYRTPYYGTPGGYVAPNSYPPGTIVQPGTTYPSPGTTYPSGPTLAPPQGGSTTNPPPLDSGDFGSDPNGNNNFVPNYRDPNEGDFNNTFDNSTNSNDFGNPPDDGFGNPPAGNNSNDFGNPPDDDLNSPFFDSRRPAPLGTESLASAEPKRLPQNNNVKPISSSNIQQAGFEQPAQPPKDGELFGYDNKQYRWLKGVIDYDPQLKNWNIIYNVNPDNKDEYGGSLTLVDGGRLKGYRSNDIVAVQGQVDRNNGLDVLGKPVYRVTNAELIGVAN
ncbi:hypothetical protein [Calycomorphotria hydatis]|uniref:Uncharacterized protein n=1 Tax=Calycomorphotria hydatis TaxID=2528027 RepID=A0A517T7K4_9PLAN|nr:hypothetical protein [Calycomorphotria hydatis]QDT64330.1 hypothetical protein V22_15630 [Calycomorphotria hydatis]